MRRRIKDYTVGGDTLTLVLAMRVGVDVSDYTDQQIIDSIRLVIDETVGLVLASSLRKDNFEIENYHDSSGKIDIVFDLSGLSDKDKEKAQKIQDTDSFTIEVDTGEVPMEVSAITDTFINALT